MKRLNDDEKKQLGLLIHYYRNLYFHSENKEASEYKQVNFCKNICSQTQLSRLEHGEPLKDQDIYELLLKKLNLDCERIATKDFVIFETYFNNIMIYQNDDMLIINYNDYVLLINQYQNIFKKNIIYTHYNYALEFILAIISENIEDADYLIEDVEKNLDILPPKFLITTLQYIGRYYNLHHNFLSANKFYLLSLEHMHKSSINNSIIYVDLAYNYFRLKKSLLSLHYINKAFDIFHDTHNHDILADIFRLYGLVYINNKYFSDAFNFINKSIEYSMKSSNTNKIQNNHFLLAVGLYLHEDYTKAKDIINETLKLKETEYGNLLRIIINKKIEDIMPIFEFKKEDYRYIYELYKSEDIETYFSQYIEKNVMKYNEELTIMIIHDMYKIYKMNKKYKMALELLENLFI